MLLSYFKQIIYYYMLMNAFSLLIFSYSFQRSRKHGEIFSAFHFQMMRFNGPNSFVLEGRVDPGARCANKKSGKMYRESHSQFIEESFN